MRPAPFEYAVPADVDQAIGLLGQFGDEAKVLAGGQSLVPMLNFRLVRPRYLIDIGRIKGLDFVSLVDGGLHIGALTRQRTVERSDLVRDVCPLLAEAIKHVGHQQTRNRGTIGGSLAHADPAAELPAVVTALDARLRLKSIAGERVLQAREFFQGSLTTALRPNELLVAVEDSELADRDRIGFLRIQPAPGRFCHRGRCSGHAARGERPGRSIGDRADWRR